ncbi:MAG: hypothetical protein LH702_13845 [Phormidesmis sp. CAN_BIN44]|nr:hypothetical protein [Phormidesmis sp. CAN_BIN44]
MSIPFIQNSSLLSPVDYSKVDVRESLPPRSLITLQTFKRREFLPSHHHNGIWQIESGTAQSLGMSMVRRFHLVFGEEMSSVIFSLKLVPITSSV